MSLPILGLLGSWTGKLDDDYNYDYCTIVAAAAAADTVVVRCVWRSLMAYRNMTTSDGNKVSNTTGIIFTGNGTKKQNKQTKQEPEPKRKRKSTCATPVEESST